MTKPLEPGCLALVVPGRPACGCLDCVLNNGKVVTVVGKLPPGSEVVVTPGLFAYTAGPSTWVCRGELHAPFIFGVVTVDERPLDADRLVRIDNPDGQDETLTWTPVNNGVTQ